jgi:hypothetical protein
MATVTFDTLELTNLLKQNSFTTEQAEAVVKVIVKAQDRLVTEDVLERHLAPLKSDILVMKWMMAAIMGLLMLIGNKILFPA